MIFQCSFCGKEKRFKPLLWELSLSGTNVNFCKHCRKERVFNVQGLEVPGYKCKTYNEFLEVNGLGHLKKD